MDEYAEKAGPVPVSRIGVRDSAAEVGLTSADRYAMLGCERFGCRILRKTQGESGDWQRVNKSRGVR